VVASIVAALAIAGVVATRLTSDRLVPVAPGSRAPDFHAVRITPDSATPPVTLANYAGQVVIVNIWATWCDPCRAEMPSLQKLAAEFGPAGLKVVAVSVDNPRMEQSIRGFVKDFGLTFDILYDATGNIQEEYQTTGVPETFVIGKDGVIRKRVVGGSDWSAEPERALVRQLLAEPAH
jgi:peroxiredoxin